MTGHERAASAFVTCKPCRVDDGGNQRLLDRERLVGMPSATCVDRAEDAGADACERVELFDRRIGAVRYHRARVPQRAERVCADGMARPEAVGEVAIRWRVRELHRARNAELCEPRD